MNYNTNLHPKPPIHFTPSNPPVDTYLRGRSENEVAYPLLNTGLSRPIYTLRGDINKTLPLEEWPLAGTYHPEVYLMRAYGL